MAAPSIRTTAATTPLDAAREIVAVALPEDERVWVPQADNVWFRPLMLNTGQRRLGEPAAGPEVRRTEPPSPPGPGPRLRASRAVALPGARLGRERGELRLRAARRDPHAGGRRRRAGDDHLLQHLRRMIYVDAGPADRLRGRLHQDRDVPRALSEDGLGEDYVDSSSGELLAVVIVPQREAYYRMV